MSFFDRFRRKKEDPEVARRALLMKSGRIGEATILEADVDAEGRLILSYCYTANGVAVGQDQPSFGIDICLKNRSFADATRFHEQSTTGNFRVFFFATKSVEERHTR